METVIRVTVIYAFILFGLRVLGKREFGQLSPLELVTLLLIPELVAQALVREDFSLTNAIVAISTLFVLVFLTSQVVHLSQRSGKVLHGTPAVLVYRGQLMEDNLNKERVTPDEVFGEMHKVGLYRLDQIRWALLETDGKIAIIPEDAVQHSVQHSAQTQDDVPL